MDYKHTYTVGSATGIMIKNITFTVSFDTISFRWKKPKHLPYVYSLVVSSSQLGDIRSPSRKFLLLPRNLTEVVLGPLPANYCCHLLFFAEYNPVRIDPGISKALAIDEKSEESAQIFMYRSNGFVLKYMCFTYTVNGFNHMSIILSKQYSIIH